MTGPCPRLILALDVPDRAAALSAVELLAGHVGYFKVGLEVFISEGPALVEEILDRGERVFLDLKLHDIPNTVAGAVRSACRLGVQMLTVHTAGGRAMLQAAREAAESSASPPMILGVTALTSISPREIRHIGIQETVTDWVERLAALALDAGLSGLVASPGEIFRLRQKFGTTLQLVVPGIRPAGSSTDDQSRVATPAEAIRAGADFLVVGRPVLRAADPVQSADQILEEMRLALNDRPSA